MKLKILLPTVFLGSFLALALQTIAPPGAPSDVITTKTVTTVAELKTALLSPGIYNITSGTYTGHYTTTVAGVALMAEPGVVFKVDDITKPVFQVSSSNFTLNGGRIEGGINEGVIVGDFNATNVDTQPDNVLFTNVVVVAPANGALRGFALHSKKFTLTFSRVENYYSTSREVQAIWINNGPGPYIITDNFLEGAGENLLAGGDHIKIPNMVPSDIYFARNTVFKRPEWRTQVPAPIVKNSFELKNAQRVVIEDNIFDGNWPQAQSGIMLLLTPRNQYGDTPWAVVDDVTLRGNTFRNSTQFAINILGHDNLHPSQQTKKVVIENNLIESQKQGVQVSAGVTENLTISHNTFPAVYDGEILLFADTGTKTVLNMNNNAGYEGSYGVFANGIGTGVTALNAACNTYSVTGNVWGRKISASVVWPPGNIVAPVGTLILGPAPDYLLIGPYAGMDAGWKP